MEKANRISVEVSYARPDQQVIIPLEVNEGTNIEDAIRQSGIMAIFPEIDLSVNKVGVFGKLGKLGQTLREKDRVEIYRKLIADPKQVRKQRAEQGKRMKKGGGDISNSGDISESGDARENSPA